jgi:AcrR family transcriptional regulator
MPRKFSDDEREKVRGKILDAGLELFGRYGPGKTTMDDIARAAGIGKGTVYLFFPSKEDLLFELIRREYNVRDTFLDRLEKAESLTAGAIRQALEDVFHEMADSPLLMTLFRGGDGVLVRRLLSEEMKAEHDCDEQQFIDSLLGILRKKGFRPRGDPEVLTGLIHVIWLTHTYRDPMFGDSFPGVEARLLDLLCDELTGE